MKRRSIITSGLLFCAASSLTISCGDRSAQVAPTSNPNPNGLKLGFSAWPGWFPWQVAQEKQLFQQAKVDVNLQWFDNYLESIAALETGKVDANSQTLADTISSIAKGKDLVVVLTNDNSTGNDKIIISEQIKSIKDLKGKKVAAEEGTVDHFLLVQALQRAGMSIKDVNFIPLETSKAAAAFVKGEVDAVAVFAPFTTKALKRPGSRELFSSKDFPGSISDHLVFTRQFVKQHPDKVQAIVNSWFATIDYIRSGVTKRDAESVMVKRAGVSMAEYLDYKDGTKLFSVDDNLEAFKPGTDVTSLPKAALETSKFLFENKLIAAPVDVSNIFDDRFVKAYAAKKKSA
jgi:NitT/TauT family transport system substrate-binding protein